MPLWAFWWWGKGRIRGRLPSGRPTWDSKALDEEVCPRCGAARRDNTSYCKRCDGDAGRGGIGLDDHLLSLERFHKVVHFEGHMRDRLDEVGIGRSLPVPLPLDVERIALMVTHGNSQVGKIDFPFKATRCGDANVIEFHSVHPTERPWP